MSPLLLFASALLARQTSIEDAGRGWRWKELDLEVWIEPDIGSVHIEGAGRLVLQAESSPGPTLLVNGALLEFVNAGSPGAKVELAARTVEASGDSDETELHTARLSFAEPRPRGAETAVHFECQSIGGSSQFAVTARASLASWVQTWYPVPDNGPSTRLSQLMAAPGLTRFHLPEGWHSVSNGERVPGEESEVETWRVTLPVARSFACAPYSCAEREVDGRVVSVYRLASATDRSDAAVQGVASCLRILESHYGPYPYPTWSVAELPVGVGDFLGSSEQGFVMVRPVAFAAPDGNLALFAHELAHGWWGNRVGGEGPGGQLLDEALAQYSAVLAIEGIEGEEAAAKFLRFSRPGYVDEQCARGYFAMLRDGHDQALATLAGGPWTHQLADAKGHWMYRMLRDFVGDEAFFATLRGVVRDFTEAPLTLDELRERFGDAAPGADVERFFAQWLDRPGAPVLEHEWSAAGGGALVRVRQVQPGEPYHLPLEIAVDSAAGREVHRVELAEREASFTLPCDAAPTGVELDPRHRLLIWTSEYGPKPAK